MNCSASRHRGLLQNHMPFTQEAAHLQAHLALQQCALPAQRHGTSQAWRGGPHAVSAAGRRVQTVSGLKMGSSSPLKLRFHKCWLLPTAFVNGAWAWAKPIIAVAHTQAQLGLGSGGKTFTRSCCGLAMLDAGPYASQLTVWHDVQIRTGSQGSTWRSQPT